jgi:hypothetical protein
MVQPTLKAASWLGWQEKSPESGDHQRLPVCGALKRSVGIGRGMQ